MAKAIMKDIHSVDAAGIKGVFPSQGNVVAFAEGLSSDAGCGKPPKVGEYGAPSHAEIPSGEKMPGGTGRALKTYFKATGGKP